MLSGPSLLSLAVSSYATREDTCGDGAVTAMCGATLEVVGVTVSAFIDIPRAVSTDQYE